MICTLCGGAECRAFRTAAQPHSYFHCPTCDLRFLDPTLQLSPEAEKERYLLHENDIEDPGYQRFLEPLYLELKKNVPLTARILDFGAGPAPALIHRLKENGYTHTALYDPYFWPDRTVLEIRYDVIVASEVIEHFRQPGKEFPLLKQSLSPTGIWVFMTHFFDDTLDFNTWYYRQDPTHLSFYSKKTMQWLQARFGFSKIEFPSQRVCLLGHDLRV